MQNSVNLTGRLTRDPDLKIFDSGDKVANFSLAVGRNYKNKNGEYEADFINCQARNGTADLIVKYFRKGSMCPVTGRLRTRKYDDNGQTRTYSYVDVDEITFVGESKMPAGNGSVPTDTMPNFDDFMPGDNVNGDDLPF